MPVCHTPNFRSCSRLTFLIYASRCSAAEAKDKTTHLALKEAKKLWDKRRQDEIDMKYELSGLRDTTKVLADANVDLNGKKVSLALGLQRHPAHYLDCVGWTAIHTRLFLLVLIFLVVIPPLLFETTRCWS